MDKKFLEDYQLPCTTISKKVLKSFKKEYSTNGIDIDEYYVDQSPSRINCFDRSIFSSFLPTGIKRIDSWFSYHIINSDRSEYTNEELETFIKGNIHLHNIIKTNLLNNLKNRK